MSGTIVFDMRILLSALYYEKFRIQFQIFQLADMKYIPRVLEGRLAAMLRQSSTVLVTGARQVGKSTLLRHLFPERRYLSLDDPFLEQQAQENGEMFLTLNPPPVTIDEVQYAPELFRHIKMCCDANGSPGLFCMTGSQQFHLMRNVTETLAGRVAVFELGGLSLREIQGDGFGRHFLPTESYILERGKTVRRPSNPWELIHRGSYPALQRPEVEWATFYADYVRTYLERDVRQLSAVQNLNAFRRFLVAAAARTGEMLNYSNIAEETGKDVNTIRHWISILEASGIVYLLEPYASSALKRATKTPKLYFRDTGLACYLLRWLTPETLANGAASGHIFETFVISEILKSFSNEGLDYRFFVSYYRGHDKFKTHSVDGETETEAEIDLIIEENGVLHPIEIKKNPIVKPTAAAVFPVLDKTGENRRGTGAVICTCSAAGLLRESLYQLPFWYI
ncbi:MAG: ATP-binding protein [Victivallales bacterium]|nr:ATP-binding protein [Victivallales bacterium]